MRVRCCHPGQRHRCHLPGSCLGSLLLPLPSVEASEGSHHRLRHSSGQILSEGRLRVPLTCPHSSSETLCCPPLIRAASNTPHRSHLVVLCVTVPPTLSLGLLPLSRTYLLAKCLLYLLSFLFLPFGTEFLRGHRFCLSCPLFELENFEVQMAHSTHPVNIYE